MKLDDKLYYSIKEVASNLGLKEYVLRYWETEFDQLKPIRNSRRRLYTQSDIELVSRIQYLLHDKGMTIKGAKKHLSANLQSRRTTNSINSIAEHLESLRDFLSKFSD